MSAVNLGRLRLPWGCRRGSCPPVCSDGPIGCVVRVRSRPTVLHVLFSVSEVPLVIPASFSHVWFPSKLIGDAARFCYRLSLALFFLVFSESISLLPWPSVLHVLCFPIKAPRVLITVVEGPWSHPCAIPVAGGRTGAVLGGGSCGRCAECSAHLPEVPVAPVLLAYVSALSHTAAS